MRSRTVFAGRDALDAPKGKGDHPVRAKDTPCHPSFGGEF